MQALQAEVSVVRPVGKGWVLVAVAGLLLAVPCWAKTSRLHPPHKNQAGALRVTQIMALATREQILEDKYNYEILIGSGLTDSDIVDGSLGVGKTFCCGKTDRGLAMYFFVPAEVDVKVGDIVEVKMGRKPKGSDSGELNTVTQVRVPWGKNDDICWWDPRDEKLWRRVLYCEWMEDEGWIFVTKGMSKAWLKPAAANGQ